MKKIILLVVITLILTGCNNKEIKKEKQITENNGMLSYTIDGEKTDIKPTKEEGYIVNKIICDNGSDMMWDNDNWEVELTKVNSQDRCKVDFTKDTSKEGYRVTVTSNMTSALDSLSKATTVNGTIIIYSSSSIKTVSGCNGIIENNKVIVKNVIENQTCNIDVELTLADVILSNYDNIIERTDFSKVEKETKLWKTVDYDTNRNFTGTSYYYTGNPDNWVSFAGVLWRIIRINGDGSVRLLYAGDGINGYLKDIGRIAYNTLGDNPRYVGWKYGLSGSLSSNRSNENKSNIYQMVENWYQTNIVVPGLEKYISKTAIYCNDRSLGPNESYAVSGTFYFSTYSRITGISNVKKPTLKCVDFSDIFSIFGLMTIDEISFAGGVYANYSGDMFYATNLLGTSATDNLGWWTMSPTYSNGNSYVWYFTKEGYMGWTSVTGFDNGWVAGVVRPVISLNKEVQFTGGDGSGNNPYTVILN